MEALAPALIGMVALVALVIGRIAGKAKAQTLEGQLYQHIFEEDGVAPIHHDLE